MRALLFFILLSTSVCFVKAKADPVDVYNSELQGSAPQLPAEVQSQLQPEPYPQPQPQIQTEEQNQVQTQLQLDPQPEPEPQPQLDSPKNAFALAFKSKKEVVSKDAKQVSEIKAVQVQTVDIEQLQKVIDTLPEEDKRTISAIKAQVATWPQEVFNEITAYREFVINSRKIAKEKYLLLSPEANRALETEVQLKARLSPSTVATLENLQLEARDQ